LSQAISIFSPAYANRGTKNKLLENVSSDSASIAKSIKSLFSQDVNREKPHLSLQSTNA